MEMNFTLAIIKPDAVEHGHTGEIIAMIEKNGFTIRAMKMTQLAYEQAASFYEVHEERPFFEELCAFMSSGPIVALSIEKDNAVTDFRKLIGATNPAEAAAETIRKKFGKSIDANAIHGSDSEENAFMETSFFFSALECC